MVLVGQPSLEAGCYIGITAPCPTPLHKVKRTTPMYRRDKPTNRTPHTRTNTTVILAESLNEPRYRKDDSFCTENNDYTVGNDLFLAKNS